VAPAAMLKKSLKEKTKSKTARFEKTKPQKVRHPIQKPGPPARFLEIGTSGGRKVS